MTYNFDLPCNRRGTCSLKWDTADQTFGGTDLLPMWVADMDFPAAPGILAGLQKRLDQQVFGYSTLSPAYYAAVIGWMARRHALTVEQDWIVFTAGIVTALNFAVQASTEPGDELLVPTPVYGPFYHAVEDGGRVLVKTPLRNCAGRYTFDFVDMERRITPKTRALMLCSPHNPVGRVWDRTELEALAAFCLRHNLTVIADEIHSDLVFQPHTAFLNISPTLAQQTILCTAPSKTFNIAGIQASNIIIPNGALRDKYRAVAARSHALSANAFVQAAVIGAYDDSEDWLDQLLVYLEGNLDLFCTTIEAKLPRLKVRKPEGTYLAWVDCTGLGKEPGDLNRFFAEECGLAVNAGSGFGDEGLGYIRVNLACSRATVEDCLRRLLAHCQ